LVIGYKKVKSCYYYIIVLRVQLIHSHALVGDEMLIFCFYSPDDTATDGGILWRHDDSAWLKNDKAETVYFRFQHNN
jgi:hypothetical protein